MEFCQSFDLVKLTKDRSAQLNANVPPGQKVSDQELLKKPDTACCGTHLKDSSDLAFLRVR